jgi:D-sedoheptulose 7-phosphate isomerase
MKDILMVFSVGGGNIKKNVSVNLIKAVKYAKSKKGKTICIVGRKDGYAYKNSDVSIFVNVADKKLVTPVSETFQTLIWHLLVSHPKLQVNKTKW